MSAQAPPPYPGAPSAPGAPGAAPGVPYKPEICKACKQPILIKKPLITAKLTEKQLLDFKETFQMFDKDGDGTINTSELATVMRSLGHMPDEEEIEEMIDDADEDGSGSINFPEFIGLMMKKQSGGLTKEEYKQAYRVFDKDGNGFVSSSELKFVMSRIGVHFTDDELNEMVLEADIDGDGQFCFEEFYNMMIAS